MPRINALSGIAINLKAKEFCAIKPKSCLPSYNNSIADDPMPAFFNYVFLKLRILYCIINVYFQQLINLLFALLNFIPVKQMAGNMHNCQYIFKDK